MLNYTSENFNLAFIEMRPKLFIEFSKCLSIANKTGKVNNFDLFQFS